MPVNSKVMVSRSALVLAARRALAYEQKSQIIQDPFAHLFINDEIMKFVRKTDAPIHYVLLRHRVIDDLLIKFNGVIEQVIIFGAGFDTRFQRLNLRNNVRFLEIDSHVLSRYKEEKLKLNNLILPSQKHLIIKTLENWLEALMATDPDRVTMILGEGFFMYHTKENIFAMLKEAVNYYAKPPFIVFDMLDPIYLNSQTNQKIHKRLRKSNENVLSLVPCAELEALFDSLGMKTLVFTPSLLTKKYLQKSWNGRDDKYVLCAYDANISCK